MIGWRPIPFIFVHIPKCAGTSIEKAFIPILTPHDTFHELTEQDRRRHWFPSKGGLQHCKLLAYERKFDADKFFKFSFVRNPWDRAVSQINYLRSVARAPFLQGKTFKQQVRAYCNSRARIWGHDLGACQLDFLLDRSGKMKMDFVGRFEKLSEDFRHICHNMGIEPVPKLPHIFNSQRKAHYSTFYDLESAEMIRNRFAKDIEYFQYIFENKISSIAGHEKKARMLPEIKDIMAAKVVKPNN